MKEDGEAIEEDGFMPKLKKAFGDVGVEIEDQNGELRSTFDILNDLAGVWDTLSSKQRQYLGEKAAGNRQVKVLNAIMANWDVVEDTIQKANEATGEATKGNEKYLDSIEGRITQFKSAFSDLARTTIDSGFIKGIVSIGTGILNITKNAGGLVPVLTTIVGIITMLKGAKIAEGLTKIGTAFKALFTGIGSLSAGAGAVGAIIAIVGVIAAVATGIKNAQKSISETAASARKNYSDQQSKVESLNGELQHTQELMSNLESKGTLSVVEQDEYDRLKQTNDELQRQIALEQARLKITQREARETTARELKQYNEQTSTGSGWITQGNRVSEGLLKTLGSDWFDKNLKREHILTGASPEDTQLMKETGAAYVPSTEELIKAHSEALLQEKKNLLEANEKFYSELAKYTDENGDFTGDEETLKYIDSLEKAKDTAQDYVNESETFLNDYLTYLEEKTAGISKVENAAPGSLDAYYNAMIEQREQIADLLLTSSTMDMSKGKQADLILAKYTEAAKAVQDLVKESGQITAEDLGSDAFKEIIAEFEKYGWSIDEVATHLTQFSKEQANAPDFVSSFDELIKNNYLATESYKALTEAMAEQEKAGTISAETFKKITADKELANYLQNTEGALRITANGLELNTEAMQDYIAIQNSKDRIEALALMQKDIALLEETQAAMQGLTDESEYAQKLDESNALQNEIDALQAYVLQLDNATSALSRYQNAKKTSNEDAAFNVGESIYKEIKEGRKTGKTGTDDFKDAVGFILGLNWQEEFSGNIEQAYSEAEKLGKRYFGQSDERTGMTNFMKDLAKATDEEGNALAEFNSKTGEFKLNTKANGESYSLEEISSALGIYSEAVSSLFGLMKTYDYDVDYEPFISPEDQKAIDEYNAKIEAQEQAVNDAKESQIKATDELAKAEEAYNYQRTKENQEALDAAKKQKEAADELVEQQQGQLDALQSGTAEPVETMSAQDALNLYNKFQGYAENGIPIKFIPQYQEVEAYLISLGVIEPKNVDIEATDKTEDGVRNAEENVNSVEQDRPIDLEGNADGVVEAANVANNAIDGIEKNPDATKLDADPTGVEEGVNVADQAMSNIDKPEPIILSARLDGTFSAIKATISGWVESIKSLIKGIGEEWEKSNKEAEDYWAQQRKWRQELNPPPDESGKPEPKQEPPEQPITSNGNNGIPSQEEVSVGAKLEEGSGNQLKNDLQQEMDDSGPVETEVQTTTEPTPAPGSTPAPSSTQAPVEMPVEASSDAGSTIREQTQEQLDSQPPVKEKVVQEQQPTQTPAAPNETKFELDLGNVDSVQDQVGQIANMSDELAGMASEAGASAGSINALNEACAELITATSELGSIDMGDPASVEAASSSISTAASNFNDAYNKLSAEINTMQTVNVGANTSSAEASIDALSNKTVTVTVVTNEVPGNAKGTRSADPGLSLVDEKGAELIEHTRRGTYELGTNNGPRITNLEAGDVVHTASETKRILSRMAKVGGFFRDGLNQAKSVLTGGAFANPKKNKYNIETKSPSNPLRVSAGGKNPKAVKSSSSKKSSSKKSGSKKSGGSKTPDIKKLQEWFEKLFDWAEVRLDRLQRKTNEWIYSAGQAIGYAAQNAQLSGAMKSVEDQIRDTTAAMKLYEDQAETVRKKTKLTDATIEKIQNGTIDISSYSKNSQERIRMYMEWYEKMLDCKEALQDLNEQQKELATQKLDNVIKSFEDRANVYENIINRRSAQMNLNTAMGIEEQESDYKESITAANNQLKTYVQEREALNNELNSLVAQGYIKKDSEEWFEYQGKIADLDTTIINTKESIIELHDAANQVNLTKLGYQLDALTNSASHLDEMMSLRQAQANEEYADSYKTLIDNGMDQIKNLQAQNEEYRKQQQGLDVMSEKYQELESNIQSNISAINQMKTSQEGWNDSVYDIQIDKINDFKDQLSKTNDLYERQKNLQDAIQELEKAQSQRTQRVFRGGGVGFVYEADQEGLKEAQENLQDVIQDELMSKMDDLIDALEGEKNNNNIYDANGNLLGTQYQLPQLDNLAGILSDYYSNPVNTRSVNALSKLFADGIVNNSNTANNKQINMNIGDIIVNEANNGNELANAIINQLPNAMLQAMYKK